VNMIAPMSDDDLRAVVNEKFVRQHRERAMSPDRPFCAARRKIPTRFSKAREVCNPFYRACPTIVQ
jgi:pyruvate-ferredoxin/flavodoxin oxidoreductase